MRLHKRIERLEKSLDIGVGPRRKSFFLIVETREQLAPLCRVTRAELRKLKPDGIERRGDDIFVKSSALLR